MWWVPILPLKQVETYLMNQYGVNFFFLTNVLEKDVYFLSIECKVLHMCINQVC